MNRCFWNKKEKLIEKKIIHKIGAKIEPWVTPDITYQHLTYGLDLWKVWPYKSTFHTWFFQNILYTEQTNLNSCSNNLPTHLLLEPLLGFEQRLDFVCWVLLKLDIVKNMFFIKSWQRIYCFEFSLSWVDLVTFCLSL